MRNAQVVQRLVVYLIKPSKYDEAGYVIRYWRGVLPSNTLACLYGLTLDVKERQALGRLTWRIEIIDENVQRVEVRKILRASRRQHTRVVACLVGVQTNQFARASDLARKLRAGGVDVLIGGFHVSGSLAMLPKVPWEIQRLIDCGVTVVAGEIEGRWEGILRDALSGTLQPIYNFLKEPPDLQSAPLPRISKKYLRRFVAPNFGTLDCGRGCPFRCSFCTVINVQGRAMRFRDVDRLVSLIRENYLRHRISYYFFTDDNFCRNRNWEALLDALIRLHATEGIRIAFMVQVDAQSYKLPRFVDKAQAAGCSQVFVGVESLNPENLKAAGKRHNHVENFLEMIEVYRKAGINTHLAYIIGFPFDTGESVRQDVERLKSEVGPEQASFFMLTPLPGSRDHLEVVQRGAPLDPDLNCYDTFQAVTDHPRMTRDEWRQAYEEAWTSFYGVENMKAILQRVSPENYWRVFTNFIWYKNATMVEGGHPMVHGFFRLKDRRERRPGTSLETRWQYFKRRAGDLARTIRGWTRLAFEMEELWLQTRPRSELEQRVIGELQRRYGYVRQWRNLRLGELRRAYCRAAILLSRAAPRPASQGEIAVPSLMGLWVKRWNFFSHSLTYSRQSLHLLQEVPLFATFAYSFFRHLLPHLFGAVAPSRR